MKPIYGLLIVAGLTVTACGKKPDDARVPADQRADSGAGMGEHRGMQMKGNMQTMMPMMQTHMDSMMRMSAGQMSQMMASHERMMSEMMDGMGSEMRAMQMTGDPKWNALSDSVKQDLAELPGLSGQALSSRMREHAGRARRLMMMHERMMKGMR
jgi:hypothetical protein